MAPGLVDRDDRGEAVLFPDDVIDDVIAVEAEGEEDRLLARTGAGGGMLSASVLCGPPGLRA